MKQICFPPRNNTGFVTFVLLSMLSIAAFLILGIGSDTEHARQTSSYFAQTFLEAGRIQKNMFDTFRLKQQSQRRCIGHPERHSVMICGIGKFASRFLPRFDLNETTRIACRGKSLLHANAMWSLFSHRLSTGSIVSANSCVFDERNSILEVRKDEYLLPFNLSTLQLRIKQDPRESKSIVMLIIGGYGEIQELIFENNLALYAAGDIHIERLRQSGTASLWLFSASGRIRIEGSENSRTLVHAYAKQGVQVSQGMKVDHDMALLKRLPFVVQGFLPYEERIISD
jgi:hypothetical protein